MTILHTKSIKDCDELEEVIHQAETEQLNNHILDLPNYDCDFLVTFEDFYHKRMNVPLAYESNLHRIFEFLETQDIQNGIDTLVTADNHLAFRAYGQSYTSDGKAGQLTTLITVKAFGEGMTPIDMSKIFNVDSKQKDEKEYARDLLG